MTVSIVIPNFNGAHYLGPCLDSLGRQTFRDFETIVVDQASDDGSRELLATDYPWVRVVPIDRAAGFARQVNAGIRTGRGTLFALLNNDTEADTRWLEELVAALQAHPTAGFAASKMRFLHQPKIINAAGDSFYVNGTPTNIGRGEPDEGQYDAPAWVLGACAGAALYRREMLEALGGFDESFGSFYEDADLNLRAQLAGYRCLYVPAALVYHVGGGSSMQAPDPRWRRQARFLASRNEVWVIVRDWPDAWLRRHGLRILRHQMAEVLMAFVRRQDGWPVLAGKLVALPRLPHLLVERRRLQSIARAESGEIAKLLLEP